MLLKVELDNGIVQVTFAVPEGYVTGIRYGGLDNILDVTNRVSDRGYWDIASASNPDNDDTDEIGLAGESFKIISQTKDYAEISFLCPKTSALPLQLDIRYVLLKDTSGFYSYAIFTREKGWPSMDVDQIRTVYKLQTDKFHYMAVSDKLQREMPMLQDREKGRPLAYKEAVQLTNPLNAKMKGEVDDKYQYACDDIDNKVHGWISSNPPIGMWMITPTDEFRMGGPHKRDLTSHVGPTMLAMFHSTHYGGNDLIMKFTNGEPWKKVFGPYLVHLNSLPGQGDPHTLWQQAKDQMLKEVKSWPYEFPASPDFPKANQRGSVEGRLLINDGSKGPVPANVGWVGLAPPGEAGSWQYEMKGYQFWTQTDKEGKFLIEHKWRDIVGNRNPRSHCSRVLCADPNPNLANPLFVHDEENKYRQYGLWDRYSELYPKDDLVYTIGVSDFRKHWFFAHVLRRTGDTYHPTTWHIVFPMKGIAPNTNYTLQIALASATQSELQVRVNNPDVKTRPVFTTQLIGRDNAIARHGIHGIYRLYTIGIPSASLKEGQNTIFLTQTRDKEAFRGVMYDYIRLEGPPSARKSLSEL
ncbi:Rhamnogalacturonate lyase [Bienertia sinuspersici]